MSIFPALGSKGRVMLGFSRQIIHSARALVSKDEMENVEENTWHLPLVYILIHIYKHTCLHTHMHLRKRKKSE